MPNPNTIPRWLKRAAPVAGALLLLIAATFYFRPEPPSAEPVPQAADPGDATAEQSAAAAEDARHEAMVNAYTGLEQDRRDLGNRLGLIKAQLWDVKLKAEQAETIRHTLMQGYALLKDPPLLGSFADLGGIEQERARLRALQSDLDTFAPIIDAARAAAGGSADH